MRNFLLLVLLVGALLCIPQVFRGALWLLIHEEAWRQGGTVRIGEVQGSLWEPVVLKRFQLSIPCADGGRLEWGWERASLECSWPALWEQKGNRRFFERFKMQGGRLAWELGASSKRRSVAGRFDLRPFIWGDPLGVPLPAKLELEWKSALVRSPQIALSAEAVAVSLSELESGEWNAARLDVNVRGWSRNFRDVRGKTSLQGGRVQLGEAQLMEGLKIVSLSAVLSEVAAGRMDVELQVEAFGGELRVQTQSNTASEETPFEASGTFSKLGVAPLAAFLNVTEAAGGTLEAGQFTFRGNTSRPELGTASLRLEAKNFQWESRQWDSLVLGALLMDQRIKMPEFALRQGHNQLVLNGDMQWPGGDSPWWKSDFGVNITARVDNLTELSALLLPEFKYAAGALTVDGAVRSQSGVLGGALIVSGANLTWRNAPIEELHAALKLQGTEIHLLKVELAQGMDLLRGKGSLKVGENWSYQGELHGNVRDLGKYAALFQPPIASEPYSGGADIDWSGKGSAAGHEGRGQARFRQLRPVREHPAWPHPMTGSFSGTYSKAGVELDALSVGDDAVQVQSAVSFGPGGVGLKGLKVVQGRDTALEGEMLVPTEIWNAWPQVDWSSFLKSSSPVDAHLVARGLNLELLGRLPGMPRALAGGMDGQWEMKGPLKALSGKGQLTLRQGGWALGGGRISGVDTEIVWDGSVLKVPRLAWQSASGRYEGSASLDWNGGGGPKLELAMVCENARWEAPMGLRFPVASFTEASEPPLAPVVVSGRALWKASGPLDAPLLSGEVVLQSVDFGGVPDLRLLWRGVDPVQFTLRGTENRFIKDWRLQLEVKSGEAAGVVGTTGAARVELTAAGTAAKPEWKGETRMVLRGAVAGSVLEVEPLVFKFTPGKSLPEIEAVANGRSGGAAFQASVVGPLQKPKREYKGSAPLSPEIVRGVFEDGRAWPAAR